MSFFALQPMDNGIMDNAPVTVTPDHDGLFGVGTRRRVPETEPSVPIFAVFRDECVAIDDGLLLDTSRNAVLWVQDV